MRTRPKGTGGEEGGSTENVGWRSSLAEEVEVARALPHSAWTLIWS